MCEVKGKKVSGIGATKDDLTEGLKTIASTVGGYVGGKYAISQAKPEQKGLAATAAMIGGVGLPLILSPEYQKDRNVLAACGGLATAGFEEWAKVNMKDFAKKVGISGVSDYASSYNQYNNNNYGRSYIPEYAPRIAPQAQRAQVRVAS